MQQGRATSEGSNFFRFHVVFSSGSSGRIQMAEKCEIYMAAFGDHLFYDLFLEDRGGGHAPLDPLLVFGKK